MKIPKDIEIKLNRMRKLELKENKLSLEAKAILSTSPMGQAPSCYHNTIGKMLGINQKRAEIWNDIRSRAIDRRKLLTLWQLALRNNLPVKTYGRECTLEFNSEDIRKLFTQSEE